MQTEHLAQNIHKEIEKIKRDIDEMAKQHNALIQPLDKIVLSQEKLKESK